MTEADLRQVLGSLENAGQVFRSYEGKLTAPQIQIVSLLHGVQQKVADELLAEIAAEKDRQRTFGFKDQ